LSSARVDSVKLAIVTTHPIQYYAPWFRHLAASMDVEVLYGYRQDARGQAAAGFGVPFEWDLPLLDGYPFRWLENVARQPGIDTFGGCDTPELYELLRRERFSACLMLGWNHKCYLQAAAACWRSGLPLLVRGDSQLGTPRGAMRRAVKSVPYRLLLPRCAAHLYVGRRNREYLRHYGVPEAKLFFSPHSVDNAFFAAEAGRARDQDASAALRAEHGIGSDDFVALFVGKLMPLKRADDLVRACGLRETLPSGRRLHAVFVGDGPSRDEIEALAQPWSDRIHFAGFVNQKQLPAWYAAADALVLCSNAETWGLVVNEAMACGVPAVVSDAVGCSPDLIEPGRTGYAYPVGDIRALCARLCDLDRDVARAPRDVARGLAEKMREYSYERATAGVRAALEACATTRSGPRPVSPIHDQLS
jgi:glycosyltransferase involved in cell wall biosynthesis